MTSPNNKSWLLKWSRNLSMIKRKWRKRWTIFITWSHFTWKSVMVSNEANLKDQKKEEEAQRSDKECCVIIHNSKNFKGTRKRIRLRNKNLHQHQLADWVTNSRTFEASTLIGTLSRIAVISKLLNIMSVGRSETDTFNGSYYLNKYF